MIKRCVQYALVATFTYSVLGQQCSSEDAPPGMVKLEYKMPKPMFISTCTDFTKCNLGRPRGDRPYPPIFVPLGCANIALKKKVTSSDQKPAIGTLSLITDGNKEDYGDRHVELCPGVQWIQIDLGKTCEIWAIVLWHRHWNPCVYHDVIVQVADDVNFNNGVQTIFNNDCDNSSGLGIGKDFEYIEAFDGSPIAVKGVKGQYVRCYSNGNTSNPMNHYIEVEVYGK
ncbi:MAG: hypothetical protein HZA88_05785 [Verrucomicrobia bacterium]|nr:hypothetical protein [Verrucomicrobiota bacterium]